MHDDVTTSRSLVSADEKLDRLRRSLTGLRSGTWEWDSLTEELSARLHDQFAASSDGTLEACRVHPEDAAWFTACARDAVRRGEQWIELPLRLGVGEAEAGWFLATGSVVATGSRPMLIGHVVELPDVWTREGFRTGDETFYSGVLDSLVEQVAILDQRGNIVYTNRAWAESELSPERSSSIGSNYFENLRSLAAPHPEIAEQLAGVLAVSSGLKTTFEHDDMRASNERWYSIRACRVDRPAGGLMVIRHDVTDRRLAERERELHRAELGRTARAAVLGQLSGAIAHELNQPLTAILANAQAALDAGSRGVAVEDLLEVLRDIEHDTKRAGEVIKRVYRLLRLDHPDFRHLDLDEIVEDILLLSRSDFLLRGVVVRRSLDASIPPLHGDAIELQQLVLNLIMNACEAMRPLERGKQELSISTGRSPSGGSRLIVSDNGPGFDLRERDKVLQPFYTTKEKGLGLGLTICRSIVLAHGGTLQLGNNDGGGACVTVDFPAAPPAPHELPAVARREAH